MKKLNTQKKIKLFFLYLIIAPIIFFSCSKKTELTTIKQPVQNHKWFYFNTSGYEQVDYPSNAPLSLKKPWTESIHISSIRQSSSFDSEKNNQPPKSFALINRLGLIEFSNDKVTLTKDSLLFKDVTASNQVLINENPIFLLYKNTFFNNSINSKNELENLSVPSIVQFDSVAKTFYPIVDAKTFNLNSNHQITDFFWNGKFWYYCIKKSTDSETKFSYHKLKPTSALLSLLPNDIKLNKETNIDKNAKIVLTNLSEKEFRDIQKINDFSKANERLKKLLSSVKNKINFEVECKSIDGTSAKKFINLIDENAQTVECKAQISDTWAAAIFNDGTMYFSGGLFNKPIINNFKTIGLRLPKLPENFIYSDFGISGNYLYVAWEESSFYEIGRAGFLTVDLDKILY